MKNKLMAVMNHNYKQLTKVGFDQGEAKNLFTISHNGTAVFDFLHDETLRDKVDPFEYYGKANIEQLIAAFENWKK